MGHRLRRQPHLRLDHQPAPHPLRADRERRAHEHDRTGGSWAALDPATGKILWQIADPQTETVPGFTHRRRLGPRPRVGRQRGRLRLLDGQDRRRHVRPRRGHGAILWQYAAGSSVNAGPAVVDGSRLLGLGLRASPEPKGAGTTKFFAFSIGGVSDTTPPTTTITLTPSSPNGSNGWYTSPVAVTVAATDNPGGSGVSQTRCVLDPVTPPTNFNDLPAGACSLTSVTGDGSHTIYAASEDNDNNVESPLVTTTFKIDQTPPTLTISGDQGTYSLLSPVEISCTAVDNPGGSGSRRARAGARWPPDPPGRSARGPTPSRRQRPTTPVTSPRPSRRGSTCWSTETISAC